MHEGRGQPVLLSPGGADRLAIVAALEPGQAGIEQVTTASHEVLAVEIGRSAMEGMEEGTGQRRKERLPAEQAEEPGEQAVFHVVNRCRRIVQVVAHRGFHGAGRQGQGPLSRDGLGLCRLRGKPQPAAQPRPKPVQRLCLLLAGRGVHQRFHQRQSRGVGPAALQQAQVTDSRLDAAGLARVRPAGPRVEGKRRLTLAFALRLASQRYAEPPMPRRQPGVVGQGGGQLAVQCRRCLAGLETLA